MSNFYQNQTFTLTTDDSQTVTYTVVKVCDDGRLLVRSSLLERAYFLSSEAFGDFLWVIGYREETPVDYYLHTAYNIEKYSTFNTALEAGQKRGKVFGIKLGNMTCATWNRSSGLKVTTEYQQWANNQECMLAKVEGSYP